MWVPKVLAAFRGIPGLTDVDTDQQSSGLQLKLVIDRAAAARYGVPASMIDQTLNDAFGQRLVSTIYAPLNQYRVVMEAAPQYQQQPSALDDIYVISASGQRCRCRALAHYELGNTPLSVNHQGLFASSTFRSISPKACRCRPQCRRSTTRWPKSACPASIPGGFQGTAQRLPGTLKNQPLT